MLVSAEKGSSMAAKMLFIYPDLGGNSISFSPAIEILSAYLKSNGYLVDLIHIHQKYGMPLDFDQIHKRVKECAPDIIGITATSFQYEVSNDICREIKNRGINIPIILGGIGATIAPELLEESCFDGFAIGEGEIPLSEVMDKIEKGESIFDTKGIHFKNGEEIIRNPIGDIINELDELPIPDYEILDTSKILELRNKWFSIAFSRGCPYSCNFCINQTLKKLYPSSKQRKYMRRNSPEEAVNQLEIFANRYKGEISVFNLDDDLLLLDKEWFYKFSELYQDRIYKEFNIKYAINGRANLLDEDIVRVLKDTGCCLVRVGFETGNEKLRNLILNKEISDKQLTDVFGYFHKYNLRSLAFAMIGIPHETDESIKESIKSLANLKPTLIRMAIYESFEGTPLYDYCKENNLIRKKNNTNIFEDSTLIFEDLESGRIRRYSLLFPWYLNAEILQEKYASSYNNLIAKYIAKIENEQNNSMIRDEILTEDKKVSGFLVEKNIEHFKYYNNNNFYYHYYTSYEEDY